MSPAEARYREGLAHLGRREFQKAEESFRAAAQLAPGHAAVWVALGIACRERGQAAAAVDALSRALAIDPRVPQANGQLGVALQALGRLPEAIDHLAAECRLQPQVARNHNNLGMALAAAGDDSAAQEAFLSAVAVDRDYAQAHANLAMLFQRRGDIAAAETAWRQVIRLTPQDAKAHANLGHLLTTGWRLLEAEPVLRHALALAPEDRASARALAYVLRGLNRVAEARTVARAILARNPGDLQAAIVDKLALPVVYASREELRRAREGYARGLDELVSEAERFQSDADQVLGLAWENFHLAYQGGDDRSLQEKYADFIAGLGRLASPRHYLARRPRDGRARQRQRVGFLSSAFRDCTAGKYFASWLTDLERDRFEVYLYYTGHVDDAFGRRLRDAVEHSRRVQGAVTTVADAVLADDLDILVYPDVGMNTTSYLLAGMRLAPVQCAAWGHPVTTGQPAIDYYITCDEMEPADAQAHYRESLVRLPGVGTRYARPGPASAKSRRELGLPEDRHLYLCPQSLFKIHPDNDGLFARVLATDPEAALVMFRDHDEPLTQAFQKRFHSELERAGIDGASRVIFLARLGQADYLRVNALCDVMLDTLHWSGGNTSLDAISVGLPIVTLPGRFMRGRQSLAMLRRMSLGELVAADEDDYVRIAVRLSRDDARREAIRERVREGSGRLFDDHAPVAALADFLGGLAAPVAGA